MSTLCKEYPQVATFFNLMTQMPPERVSLRWFLSAEPASACMSFPVEKAIEAQQESQSDQRRTPFPLAQQIRQILCRAYAPAGASSVCAGEGNGDIEGDFCIGVGDMAEYCVDTSAKGRYINL
jgi:hypothetical protein